MAECLASRAMPHNILGVFASVTKCNKNENNKDLTKKCMVYMWCTCPFSGVYDTLTSDEPIKHTPINWFYVHLCCIVMCKMSHMATLKMNYLKEKRKIIKDS